MRPALLVFIATMQLGAPAPCPCADVQLMVADLFGDPVPIATLHVVGDTGDIAAQFQDGRAKLVPYGRYEITVISPGFNPWHREVEVQNAKITVPVGMETGGIEAPPKLCSIEGRVLRVPGARARPAPWVRAQAVFGYESFATAAGSNGFSFESVPCGKYLFIVVSGADVIATASTVITPNHRSINIAVGGASAANRNSKNSR